MRDAVLRVDAAGLGEYTNKELDRQLAQLDKGDPGYKSLQQLRAERLARHAADSGAEGVPESPQLQATPPHVAALNLEQQRRAAAAAEEEQLAARWQEVSQLNAEDFRSTAVLQRLAGQHQQQVRQQDGDGCGELSWAPCHCSTWQPMRFQRLLLVS